MTEPLKPTRVGPELMGESTAPLLMPPVWSPSVDSPGLEPPPGMASPALDAIMRVMVGGKGTTMSKPINRLNATGDSMATRLNKG